MENMLRSDFIIKGYFYELKGYKFRKYLNIIEKKDKAIKPDIIVVMMNPGSSKPLNSDDDYRKETDTYPDKTQDQIMKVMNNCGFKYARILNLSDLREPKSKIFYNKIKELDSKDINHSIFSKTRKSELKDLFIENIPVVFAWGVSDELKVLANMAVKTLNTKNPFGMNKINSTTAYLHPLPPNSHKQQKWVDDISLQIKTSRKF